MPLINKRQKLFIALCIFSILNIFSFMLFSEPTDGQTNNETVLSEPENAEIDVMLKSIGATRTMPDPTIEQLAETLSIFIQQPLWTNTRVPAARDALYLMPYKFSPPKKSTFTVNFFYNEIPNMRITIGNLLQTTTIANEKEMLDTYLESIQNPDDRAALMPIFRKVSIQERRFGFFLQSNFKKDPFSFQIHLPLIIEERNCWLSINKIRKVLNILDVKLADIPIGEFYKLQPGIGDTRLVLGLDDLEISSCKINIGFQGTIPTSKLSYSPKYETNVEKIPDIADIDNLTNEMLKIARNIRNYLLDPRFGNSGHFGAGIYTELRKSLFNDRVELWTRISLNQLFDANEDRLFFFKQTISTSMLNTGQQTYNYLKQFVFPSSYNVKISPGTIINGIIAASTTIGSTRWTCGYDFYEQQHEVIKKINHSTIPLSALKIKEAQSLKAQQHKLFAEALYKNKKPVTLGIGGDATIASVHIGKDWTVYFKSTLFF
ncbi:MAG: hypothetical protein ABH827_04210 [bacterium]